jgi:hypothetical protein
LPADVLYRTLHTGRDRTVGRGVPVNKALAEFARRGWIRLDDKTVWICDSERRARRAK